MNYTENYHLPQWDLSDRIMMQDFNQAMSGIDAGLAAAQNTAANYQLPLQESEARVTEGIFRAAYNHYNLVKGSSTLPHQEGIFFQRLNTSTLPSNVSGMLARGSYAWMNRAESTMTADRLLASFVEVSAMRVNRFNAAANTPLLFTFTPTAAGLFSSMNLRASYTNTADDTVGDCTATLTDVTTDKVEWRATLKQHIEGGSLSGYPNIEIALNIWLHAGHEYRFEMNPIDIKYNGYCTITNEQNRVAATFYNLRTAEATQELTCEEVSRGGLVLARYTMYDAGGTISLLWDGMELAPAKIRTVVDNGQTLQEAEFRRTDAIAPQTSLTLKLTCNTKGEISLYNWGAILI